MVFDEVGDVKKKVGETFFSYIWRGIKKISLFVIIEDITGINSE